MKVRIAILVTALAGLNLFAISPASASCTEIIDDAGCVENWVCPIGDRFGWQCIE